MMSGRAAIDYVLKYGVHGYKVVTLTPVYPIEERKLFSFVMYNYEKAGKEYSPDFVTTPNPECGPLSYFDTLGNAINSIRGCICGYTIKNVELWSCVALPSEKTSLWYCFEYNNLKHKIARNTRTPEGTRFADSIILNKKIDSFTSTFDISYISTGINANVSS